MGKTLDYLQRQTSLEKHKKDAEDCIEIYNKLKELDGHVWDSKWRVLTNTVGFEGKYPNSFPIVRPSEIGYSFIKTK